MVPDWVILFLIGIVFLIHLMIAVWIAKGFERKFKGHYKKGVIGGCLIGYGFVIFLCAILPGYFVFWVFAGLVVLPVTPILPELLSKYFEQNRRK